MKALHQRVNIVPVLAKADTLTPTEVGRMKNKVGLEDPHLGSRGLVVQDCY